MPKILFDLVCFPDYGGISTVTLILAKELASRGYEIDIVSHRKPNREYVDCHGISYIYYTPDSENLKSNLNFNYYKQLLNENSYDLIIYQDSYAPIHHIVIECAKIYAVPIITVEHNTPLLVKKSITRNKLLSAKGFLRRALNPIYCLRHRKIRNYIYNNSDLYLTLSKAFIDEFIKVNKIKDTSKLGYINNPANFIDSGNLTKDNLILYVGRIVREKNVKNLIKTWDKISKLLKNWEFIIVGDGEEFKSCQKYICDNKIERIQMVGYTSPLEYFKKAKIFWMQSKYEGWPMSLFEAMSLGTIPVVMNTFSSLQDIVIHKYNGLIIPQDNNRDFINATLELSLDNELFLRMSSNAIKSVKNFSPQIIANKWVSIIDEVLINHRKNVNNIKNQIIPFR